MPINAATIYSVLGSQSSLVPLVLKDTLASVGMTAGSYITGKEEGQDRFIDEFGTEAIWIGGIPAYKGLFDKTVYKVANLDASVDVRNLKNKAILEKAKQYAPSEETKKSIIKIEQKQALAKKMAASKFVISTLLAIATYVGLTKLKQWYTKNQIKKNLIKEYNQNGMPKYNKNDNEIIKDNISPSFKSLGSLTENLAYNSVKNMWVMDGAITLERLNDARTLQELIGYAVKEAYAISFLYIVGGQVQKFIENYTNKKLNKNIVLDSRILEAVELRQIFEDNSVKQDFEAFDAIKNNTNPKEKLSKDAVALYDFLHNNPDNAIVKFAKKSDVIKMYNEPKKWYEIFKKSKKTDKIDTRTFIDLEQIESINNNLRELYTQYNNSVKNGDSTEKFFKSLKKYKRGSILMNMGVSIFALGILAPATMYIIRKFRDNDMEFQTKKEIREQLIQEGIIA